MKTINVPLFFFFIITMISCQSTTEVEKGIAPKLTRQEQLELVYTSKVLPLFKGYDTVEIPTEFVIDKKDLSINAGASFGYVEVSQGLINSDKEAIQLFVLAHEVAHIVTISQAITFELGDEIPTGVDYNPYQKAELLADLVAVHHILVQLPEMKSQLENEMTFLKSLLGTGGFTHPSGAKRVVFMQDYFKLAKITSANDAFRYLFTHIWQL